jgi:hypothetical protein
MVTAKEMINVLAENEDQRNTLLEFLNLNAKRPNRNIHKKDAYMQFLESKRMNSVIYAPSHIGTLAASCTFIEACLKYNTPVIISTNDTIDQGRLYYQIHKVFSEEDIMMLKVGDKNFKDKFKECISMRNMRFIIFCLDNQRQIEKLTEQLTSNYMRCSEMKEIKRLAIIHDETYTDAPTERERESERERELEYYETEYYKTYYEEQHATHDTHEQWVELKDLIYKNMNMDLKIIYMNEMPENCIMMNTIDYTDNIKLVLRNKLDMIEHIQ